MNYIELFTQYPGIIFLAFILSVIPVALMLIMKNMRDKAYFKRKQEQEIREKANLGLIISYFVQRHPSTLKEAIKYVLKS